MYKVNIVVAYNLNNVIGIDNKIPWHIPEDLKYFKEVTMGRPVIMGRKTHESIEKQLPGRLNIVLTKNFMYEPHGLDTCVYCDPIEALRRARQESEEIFIIGGAKIYESYLNITDKIYATIVKNNDGGDTYFPKLKKNKWNKKIILQTEQYDRIVFERRTK